VPGKVLAPHSAVNAPTSEGAPLHLADAAQSTAVPVVSTGATAVTAATAKRASAA